MQALLLSDENHDTASLFIQISSRAISFNSFWHGEIQLGIFNTLLAISWAYIILFAAFITYIGTKVYKGQVLGTSLRRLAYVPFNLHFGFIFWIVNMVLLVSFSQYTHGIKFFSVISSQSPAFSNIQALIISINYVLGIITALFCFDPFCSDNEFAARNPSHQVLNFLLKAFLAPLAIFANPHALLPQLFFVIIAFVILMARVINLIKFTPLYYYKSTKTATIFCVVAWWITFINILALIWKQFDLIQPLNPLYLTLFPLPLIIIFFTAHLKKTIESSILANPTALMSKYQVYKKIMAFSYQIEKVGLNLNSKTTPNWSEIYFMGGFTNHIKTCEDSACMCGYFSKEKLQKENLSFSDIKGSLSAYFQAMQHTCISEAIKRGKGGDDLKIALAYLIFTEATEKLSGSLLYLFSISNKTTISFYRLLKKHLLINMIQERIHNYYTQKHDGVLNMEKFVNYHQDTTDFYLKINSITQRYLNFWETYKNSGLKALNMLSMSTKIEEEADDIERLWNINVDKHESFCQVMKSAYRWYLVLIRNTPFTSRKMIQKFKWRRNARIAGSDYAQDITENDLVSPKVLSFYISMARERLGRILYASENSEPLIGFTQQDMISKNINFLMPPSIAEKHDQLVLRHLDRSKASHAKNSYILDSYIKTKKGFILPCTVQVSIFPYLQKELMYIGAVKILKSKLEFIILDYLGHVDSFTEAISKDLGLNVGQKIHIRELCANNDKLNTFLGSQTIQSFNQASTHLKNPVARLSKSYTINFESLLSRDKILSINTDDFKPENTKNTATVSFTNQKTKEIIKYDIKIVKKTLIDSSIFVIEMERTAMYNTAARKRTIISPVSEFSEHSFIRSIPEEGDKEIFTSNFTTEQLNFDLGTAHGTPAKEEISPAVPDEMPITEESQNEIPEERAAVYTSDGTNDERLMKFSSMNPFRNTTESGSDTEGTMNKVSLIKRKGILNKGNAPRRATFFSKPKINSQRNQTTIQADSDAELLENRRKSPGQSPTVHHIEMIQSERGSAASSVHNTYPKLEQAVYSLPPDNSTRALKLASGFFLFSCVIFLIVFFSITRNNLNSIDVNVSLLSFASLRTSKILEVNRAARMLSLYSAGLVDKDRYHPYGDTKSNLQALLLSKLRTEQSDLSVYNNIVRVALDRIKPSLYSQFFTGAIPVNEVDGNTETLYTNTFDLATSLSVRAKVLAGTPPEKITVDDSNMNFILNNTLNDLLISSERITRIVLDDNDYCLNFIEHIISYFIGECCLLGVIMLLIFVYKQYKVLGSRNRLIDLFLRLNEDDLSRNLNRVRIFRSELENSGLNFKSLDINDLIEDSPLTKEKSDKLKRKSRTFRMRRKEVDKNGLNTQSIKAGFLFMVLISLAVSPFIYLSIVINVKKEQITREITTFIKINTDLYDLNMLSSAIYEYIQFDGTTKLRNQPIGSSWTGIISSVSNSQSFFSQLKETETIKSKDGVRELNMLVGGDLCNALNLSASQCSSVLNGPLNQGIVGLNSYMMMGLEVVKDRYDSDKSLLGAQAALKDVDLIKMEVIYPIVTLPAYAKLSDILKTQINTEIAGASDLLKTLLIISVVAYAVLGYLLSSSIWVIIEDERVKWRKLVRKIPFNMIISNKMLKTYLEKECSHILGSIKRYL